MRRFPIELATLAVSALVLGAPINARSEGALVIGSTGSVEKHGIALGVSFNQPTKQAAIDAAMAQCRTYPAAKIAVDRCQLVTTFKRECYAFASDPKAGTPGIGWALAKDKEAAVERALAFCRATAGTDRQKFCVVNEPSSRCDYQAD